MHHRSFPPVARELLVGLDLLVVALTVVGFSIGVRRGAQVWLLVGAALLVLGVYAGGRLRFRSVDVSRLDRRGGDFWEIAWVVALVVSWVLFTLVTPAALWLSFALMLVQMHVLGPFVGGGAVVVTAGLTIALQVCEGTVGPGSLGGVVGPVLGAALAIGVVVGLEALAREGEVRARMVQELAVAREHLAHAERERAVAAERERLAREIHDTLAQGFVSIDLLLRAAQSADSSVAGGEFVERAAQTARSSLEEARRFVRGLAPGDLDAGGLVAALRRQVEALPPPLQGRFAVDGVAVELPLAVESALLRIAQSALANVRQHAQASCVVVTLSYEDEQVALDVVDDGRGFDPADPPRSAGGFGLCGIASRVRELHGTSDVESSPDGGTAVVVRIPVAGAESERRGE
ncbi:Sensor protein degS [Dermatophilus congolensis]|uniref:Sensor protein degS n=1 Tax=Dermatophilus congolensis TaxID=1863 RepID=A0A239VES7_9MICO|nr:sensor histidine kinase [Dermatophilus congolensis]SNV20550.1 Sensor protein degS [Dermatophilus congolensis]